MSFRANELEINAGIISATIVIVIVMISKMNVQESAAGTKATIQTITGIGLTDLQTRVVVLFLKLSSFVHQLVELTIMPPA
ncbi:MAG: hypothetical protein ACRC01_13200 [Deefgea sp.]